MTADAMFAFADAYERHIGRYSAALAAAQIAAARVRPGDRVLDVGCGPGALTEGLARHVGAANVTAVEPSEAFAAACAARVPGADVRVGTAEAMPAFDEPFDVVLSQLVVNFMTDAPAGVAAMRAACREGGVVASCVWDYAGEMTLLRAFWEAALALDADAPDEGRTMRYCTPGELASLWREAGLDGVVTSDIRVSADYDDFDDLWAPFVAGVGPAGAYCAALTDPERERLREEFHRRLGSPSSSFTLGARAWFVRGAA